MTWYNMSMNKNQEKVIEAMRKFVGRNMKEANNEVGVGKGYVGECKATIQQIVSNEIGLWLPKNDSNLAKKFQWEQTGVYGVKNLADKKKLHQSPVFSSFEDFENRETGVYPYDIKGTIMQVMFDKLKVPNAAHWHTCIVTEHNEDNMVWVDVNYNNDNICKEHTISNKTFNDMCICFRLYTLL